MNYWDRVEVKLDTFEAMTAIVKLVKEYVKLAHEQRPHATFVQDQILYEMEEALEHLEEQKI